MEPPNKGPRRFREPFRHPRDDAFARNLGVLFGALLMDSDRVCGPVSCLPTYWVHEMLKKAVEDGVRTLSRSPRHWPYLRCFPWKIATFGVRSLRGQMVDVRTWVRSLSRSSRHWPYLRCFPWKIATFGVRSLRGQMVDVRTWVRSLTRSSRHWPYLRCFPWKIATFGVRSLRGQMVDVRTWVRSLTRSSRTLPPPSLSLLRAGSRRTAGMRALVGPRRRGRRPAIRRRR